jgi:hypothetical protein
MLTDIWFTSSAITVAGAMAQAAPGGKAFRYVLGGSVRLSKRAC